MLMESRLVGVWFIWALAWFSIEPFELPNSRSGCDQTGTTSAGVCRVTGCGPRQHSRPKFTRRYAARAERNENPRLSAAATKGAKRGATTHSLVVG